MSNTVKAYEADNGELNGSLEEKVMKIPVSYLEKNGYTVFEKELSESEIIEVKRHQNIIEL